jgi:hypothetical protein
MKWISSVGVCAALGFVLGCGSGEEPLPGESHQSSAAADPVVPTAPAVERASLELRLSPGDRFPLRKVVEQELIQTEAGREPETSRSRLEMLMAITVEDVTEAGTRFAVRYDRIRYARQVGNEVLQYDSLEPPVAVPLELAAYQGMLGQGFSFRIGRDNRIAEVIGFAEFLQASLRDVPEENRSEVLLGVETSSGEDGVTDFVDDTIGLLPFDSPKSPGDTWRRPRDIARPVPMHINTVCTLRDLTPEIAVVDLRGQITPVMSSGVQAVSHENVHLLVRGGGTEGHCVIYRDTGLPKESHVVQTVDMTVSLPGGQQLEQQKRVVTRVESYPMMESAGR